MFNQLDDNNNNRKRFIIITGNILSILNVIYVFQQKLVKNRVCVCVATAMTKIYIRQRLQYNYYIIIVLHFYIIFCI